LERRLAAILAADMVGYSRLMAEDEVGTLRALKEHRCRHVEPAVTKFEGRIFKLIGDGMLVEFPSAVGAVKAAMAIQQESSKENDLIRFRMGISLGDVLIDGDDVYGHGVNIAARLEGLAIAGGLCISDVVYQQVRQHIPSEFTDAGQVTVKNIETPIQVWHWPNAPAETRAMAPSKSQQSPDKPAIAVLPFQNLSSDPEQSYFCDGIVEEIVNALAKIERLTVIDRASTQAYKNSEVDVCEVGREQRVRFVLKGSARRQGERVRVIAQLSDVHTGKTIFSERYNRKVDNIFDVQDEITREIASSLQVQLTDGDQARLWASGTRNLDAWELCIRAAELIDKHVLEDNHTARRLLEEALQLDPVYAIAWCKLGWTHWCDARHGWTTDATKSLTEAKGAAQRAHEFDPDFAEPFALLAMSAMQAGEFDAASEYVDRALERATGQSFVLATVAMVLGHCGRAIDSVDVIRKAIALCPIYPDWYKVQLGRSYYLAGDFESAIRELGELYGRDPMYVVPGLLVAALFESGRVADAKAIIQEEEARGSGLSTSRWAASQTFKDPTVVEKVVSIWVNSRPSAPRDNGSGMRRRMDARA
jgi:adenylate cyclase